MFGFELFEFIFKLVMPRVQDTDLETEGRAGDDKVCQ